jgi:heat shock protein HtpX
MILLGVVMVTLQYFFPDLLKSLGSTGNIILYAAIFWFGWAIISLFLSRWQAKRAYSIVLIEKNSLHTMDVKLQMVYEVVERIAKDNSIDMPEVGYYESAEPNAFATGATKNSALVAVSTGLLNNMKDDEIRGVVWHEMAHILNGDMVTLTLITGVVNTFVIVVSQIATRFVVNFLSRWEEGWESIGFFTHMVIYNILQAVFGLLASGIVMAFSRHREYRADIRWAWYTGKASMIAALKKLQNISKLNPSSQRLDHGNLKAFMITEPDSYFSTHPSLDNRIKALEENYKLA